MLYLKKPNNLKILLVFIASIILLATVVLLFYILISNYYLKLNSDANDKTKLNSYSVGNLINSSPDNILNMSKNLAEYKFKDYPVKFNYDTRLTLLEDLSNTKQIKLKIENSFIMISPAQKGVGFDDQQEVLQEYIDFENKKIVKYKITNKTTGEITYLVTLPYPESLNRDYIVLISYNLSNDSSSEYVITMFDKLIASTKIGY